MFRSLVFLKNAILRFGQIGAVWPSSRFLARAMVPRPHHRTQSSVVVEIGAGTGSLTAAIAASLEPGARLFLVECNPEFVKILRKRFPEAETIEGDAQELGALLRARGVEQIDCVVSGLPFTNFPDSLSRNILREVREMLAPEGQMVAFQYIHSRLLRRGKKFFRMLNDIFPTIRSRRIFLNIPSAYVYRMSTGSPKMLRAPTKQQAPQQG